MKTIFTTMMISLCIIGYSQENSFSSTMYGASLKSAEYILSPPSSSSSNSSSNEYRYNSAFSNDNNNYNNVGQSVNNYYPVVRQLGTVKVMSITGDMELDFELREIIINRQKNIIYYKK